MIVLRFRAVGLVAGVATAALGCYLMTQRVAGERQALARVEHRILLSKREIRRLATEIETRGRLSQLELWNRDVLALSAPRPGQFVAGEVQLASFNHPDVPALDPAALAPASAVRTVAYIPTTAPARGDPPPSPQAPVLRRASYVRAKGAGMTMLPEKIALSSSDFAADLAALAANEAALKRSQ